MEPSRDVKAGPSELPQEWASPSSRRRRQGSALLKPVIAIVLIILGYVGFVHILSPRLPQSWGWMWRLENHDDGDKGSKYLLGVGKADITGYFTFESSCSYVLIAMQASG
jgi:hypothetical protein